MKQRIRRIINNFGYDVIRYGPTRIGANPFADMARFLHNDHPIVLDVGANVGQSIRNFRNRFPRCTIHSFEPSPTTFALLKQNASTLKDVHLWNCALGSVSGEMKFLENTKSHMSSFLPLGEFGWGTVAKETMVETRTVDQFCHEQHIEHIDVLKSDTQGFELEVFRGAECAIRSSRIGLIYCEIIFSDMYKNRPSFAEIYEFLTSRDFLLVSFYGIAYQKELASWTDALFARKSYIQTRTQLQHAVPGPPS